MSVTLLVVDDDRDLRESLCDVLEAEGFHCVAAADGRDALKVIEANPHVSLILLDLMMPGMNGWEFREAQLANPRLRDVPTVIMTANASADRAPIQAEHFLWKPVGLDRLLAMVHSLLEAAKKSATP